MIILAFDTAMSSLSVGLIKDGGTLFEVIDATGKHHGETLMPAVEYVMRKADIKIEEVDLLAATIGPGSFTGLRVGMSTLKGLACATSLPAVGISTLDALAFNAAHLSIPVCAVLDARKGEIYAALYMPNGKGELNKVVDDRVSEPKGFFESLSGEIYVVGDGAETYKGIIRKTMGDRCIFSAPDMNVIRATSVGVLGLKKFRDGDTLNIRGVAPRYLRGSYADRMR